MKIGQRTMCVSVGLNLVPCFCALALCSLQLITNYGPVTATRLKLRESAQCGGATRYRESIL